MWVAAGNPSTFTKAARMGLGVLCFTIGGPESVKPLVELYKNEIANAEPVGDFVNDNIMVTTQLLCLEDGQRARNLGADMGQGYHRSLLLRYLDTFPRPAGIPEWPALLPDPTPAEIDASIKAGETPYGTPEEVEVAIRKYADAGVDQVVFGLLSSTMERDLANETIETFGKHVLPIVRHRPGAPHDAPARSRGGVELIDTRRARAHVQPRRSLGDALRRGSRRGVPRRPARAAHARLTRPGREPDREPSDRDRREAGGARRHLLPQSGRVHRSPARMLEVRRGSGQRQLALRRRRAPRM